MAATIINRGADAITQITAAQDINLSTVTIAEQNNSIRNTKNYVKHGGTQDIGSTIQTNGDITLNAGNDFNAKAANITSETGAINITATKDINITEGRETSNFDTARKVKKSSTFSSKTKSQRDVFESDNSISSNLSADNITLQAGNDLTVRGSNIVSDNNTTLNANNNINITSAQNTAYEQHERKTKTSGLSTSGASVTLGTSQLNTKQTTNSTSQTGSTVGSVEGNVNINSGNTYTQTGSDILTPQGNIDITAQQVNILAAQNTSQTVQETKFKQTGLTLAISNPVISAIQTAQQMSQAASQTSDSRMQALAAGTIALSASNAYDATSAALNAKPTGSDIKDAANQAGGINVSLSIGTSKSSSKTTQTSSTAQSSTLNAGGDINITAVRPELVEGQNAGTSNINVIGSQIKAANNVTLKADDQINLLAAQNTNTLDGKNKSSSASLGVSFGTSGLAVTASASQGKGKANGTDVTWTETALEAGNKVTLESGTDTNLIGAQVRGEQVVADVGTSGDGNLNIQSLQDTSTYDSKQKSAGISVSVPIGAGAYGGSISASNSNTQSNYASVNEQSGIMAGDGGFQVTVNGNTNLTGAVIASTQAAIQNNANSLTTQTLTTSNIENSAEYEAKGISLSAGVGLNQQPDGTGYKNTPTASAGSANLSDDSSSVTVSGISGGTINITDPSTSSGQATQTALTGKDTATTLAMLNRDVSTQVITNADGSQTSIAVDSQGNNLAGTLTPIFDKEQVQRELNAQIQITQAFSQVAPKAVGDYATNKFNELKNTNPEEAAKWDEGGIYRIALHTALGGLLTGDLSGAAGAGVVASAAPLLNDLQSKVTEALQNAGLGEQGANTISQALAELTSLGIGSAIGGTAGASTALVVDTNNRQLHETEIQRAKDLYQIAKSKGLPYTLAQIEDALRAASNSEYGETAISNIIYNHNAPTGQNNQSGTDMYTGTVTDLMNPGTTNGSWTLNPQTGALIQSVPTSSADLIGFVQTYTGGSNSVYSWSVGTSATTIANANTSPFGDGWSYMGANSAGLSAMPPIDTRTQAQIDADQNRFVLGVATLPLAVVAAPFIAETSVATQSVMAIGGTASFVFDTAGQYVNTDGFTTGDYRPGQSVFAAATGAVLAPLGLSWTSTGNLSLNVLNAAVLGGTGAATTTTFNNYYYNENTDVGSAAGVGAVFGVAGLGATSVATQYIVPLNSNISILMQDYYRNFLINNGIGAAVSSSSPLFETPDVNSK
jgi:filamentous hemagglutinin